LEAVETQKAHKAGRLEVELGPRQGERFLLQPFDQVKVGSGPECNIPLEAQGLAAQQMQIVGQGDGFLFTTLADGVTVNGEPLPSGRLQDGDIITAGDVRLRFSTLEPQRSILDEACGLDLVDFADGLVRPQMRRRIEEDDLATSRDDHVQGLLKAVYDVGAMVSGESSQQRILDGIVEKALEVLQANRGFLILRNGENDQFEPAVIRTPGQKTEGLALSRTVLRECIEEGTSILLRDALTDLQAQPAHGSLFRHGIRSAICVPVESKKEILGALYVDNTADVGAFDEGDMHLLAALGRMAGLALERVRLIERQDRLFYGVIRALVSSLEAKDQYTRGHTERVTAYALIIAQEMGLSQAHLQELRLAGLLHDIGKIGVPEAILCKPGKLTPDELEIMRRHPDIGADIVQNIEGIGEIAKVVRHHQEKWDGSGYPAGLQGEAIPLLDRILAVADAYDAMTSSRAYRRNFSEEEVLAEFRRCAGHQFDPQVVEAFFRVYARGALVAPAKYMQLPV
jgi:putative nucleotidyltransferase with HDIG domain